MRMRLLLPFVALLARCSCGPPAINQPVLAAIDGRILEVNGTSFGSSGELVVADVTLPSTTNGAEWTDTRIAMPIPAGLAAADVVVRNDAGTSNAVPLELYAYESFAIPPTPGTNASPLAIAVVDDRIYVNEEFHRAFQTLDVAANAVTALPPMPRPPEPGPFAVYFERFCLGENCVDDFDARTQTSVLGEDVIVDTLGRVWFSEGGALLYEQRASTRDPNVQVQVFPNHSRIVMFDPSTSSYRVYNVPGDRNEVIGLAWDGALLWFAQGGRVAGGAIGSLDPEAATFNTASPAFDFSTPADNTGWRFFDVPDPRSYPAFPLVDPDGHIWFTTFLGNAVGRLDPSSGDVEMFALPPPRATRGAGAVFATGGAWRIAFDSDGDVVFDESFDFEITKLDAQRVRDGDRACRGVPSACLRSISIADPNSFPEGSFALLHTITVDGRGRIWFTQMGDDLPDARDDRIGFVTPDFEHVVAMPGLVHAGPNGIALDDDRNVWFVEFFAHNVSVLRPVIP
jgi:streptogramin lyase